MTYSIYRFKMSQLNKTYVVQPSDIDLLRKAGVSEDDIAHDVKVAEKALEIAVRTNKEFSHQAHLLIHSLSALPAPRYERDQPHNSRRQQ